MPKKIVYCFKLLGQAGFLPVFSPAHCMLIVFPLLTILLGTVALSGYYMLSSHYVGHILAFVYVAAVYGAAKLIDKLKLSQRAQSYLSVYLIVISLFSYGKTDAYKLSKFMKGIREYGYAEKISYLSLIPADSSVSAVSNLVPHLSHRKYIYDWQPERKISLSTDYVVIDLAFLGYLAGDATRDKVGEYFRRAQNAGYKIVFVNSKGTFFILHNPGNDNTYIKGLRVDLVI